MLPDRRWGEIVIRLLRLEILRLVSDVLLLSLELGNDLFKEF